MPPNETPAPTKKIGLIGGLALRAGVFYYEQIQQRCVAENRQLRLILEHADVNTVLACVSAGDKAGLGRYLGSIANALFDAGADLVAVTAVAPHLAIDEIVSVARGPIVNLLDHISVGLADAGVERVAIFGNRAVMQTGIYGIIPTEKIVPLEPSIIDHVHAMYTDIALCGKRGTPTETEFLEGVARTAVERDGAQAILLAGTDLSSFYAGQAPTFPHLDLAQLHINAIIDHARAPNT